MSVNRTDMVVVAGKVLKLLEPMNKAQKSTVLAFVENVVLQASDEPTASQDDAELVKL